MGNKRTLTLLGLYLAPVLLAWLLMAESRGNPFFENQLSDGKLYLAWAEDFSRGKGFGPLPFSFNPLYPLLLAGVSLLGIGSVEAIRWMQVLLGSAAFPLVFLLGRRLWGPLAGWLAYGLALGYGVLLHALTDLSSAWLESLLVLLFLLLAGRQGSRGGLAAAGLVAGAAALCKPSYLPLGLAVPALLALGPRGDGGEKAREGLVRALLFLAAFSLAVLPVTLRNAVVGKDLVAVASTGGITFFIGNSPGARGIFYAPPGFHEDPVDINQVTSRALAERDVGRPLKPSEVSRYWFGKGLRFLVSSPGAALDLYARKALLVGHSVEVSLNSNYALFRESAPVLRFLPVPFSLLFALGTAGVFLSWRRKREFALLYLVLGIQVLSLLAFFVSSRYRLPTAPLLAVFAGGAAAWAWENRRTRKTRAAALAGAVAIAAVALSLPYPPIAKIQGDSLASSYEMIGIAYFEEGKIGQSLDALTRAVAIRPAIRHPHWYLARIFEGKGMTAEAAREWMIAARLYPPGSVWAEEALKNYRRLATAR